MTEQRIRAFVVAELKERHMSIATIAAAHPQLSYGAWRRRITGTHPITIAEMDAIATTLGYTDALDLQQQAVLSSAE